MQRLKAILSQVLDVKAEEINDQTSPETVENWDSFNALILVSELERQYQVKFTMQEITSVKSVKDIKNCLARHGVQFEEEKQNA